MALRSIQRTLVLTVGSAAQAAGRLMETEFGQQLDQLLPVVAWVSFETTSELASWREKVDPALWSISQLGNRASLKALGFHLDRLDEISVWLVVELATVDGKVLADRAQEIQKHIVERLGATPVMTLLLLDDGSSPAQEALAAVDLIQQGNTGWEAVFLEGLLNQDGLALQDQEALAEQVGLLLYLLVATPLRELRESASFYPVQNSGYASLGVYRLRWDAAAVENLLVDRKLQLLLGELLNEPADAAPLTERVRLEAELRQLGLAPKQLMDAFLSPGMRVLDSPPDLPLPWGLVQLPQHFRDWEATRAKREESLQTVAQELVESAQREHEASFLAWFDDPARGVSSGMRPSELARAGGHLNLVRQLLEEWQDGLLVELGERQQQASELAQAAQAAAEELAQLCETWPPVSFREGWQLVRRPWRWLPLYRLYRQIEKHSLALSRYHQALWEQQLFASLGAWAQAVYSELQSFLQGRAEHLACWRDVLLSAIPPDPEPVLEAFWQDDDFLGRLEQLALAGDEQVIRLPYSLWEEAPKVEAIGSVLDKQVRNRYRFVHALDVLEALALRLPGIHDRAEWLQEALALACPWWQVDLTRLDDVQRQGVQDVEAFLRPASFSNRDEAEWPGTERISHYCSQDSGRQLAIVRKRDGVCLDALHLSKNKCLEG